MPISDASITLSFSIAVISYHTSIIHLINYKPKSIVPNKCCKQLVRHYILTYQIQISTILFQYCTGIIISLGARFFFHIFSWPTIQMVSFIFYVFFLIISLFWCLLIPCDAADILLVQRSSSCLFHCKCIVLSKNVLFLQVWKRQQLF